MMIRCKEPQAHEIVRNSVTLRGVVGGSTYYATQHTGRRDDGSQALYELVVRDGREEWYRVEDDPSEADCLEMEALR